MQSSIFGPVLSRRFGLSLGVDLVGEGVKKCNFDCLYCELPKGQKVSIIDNAKDPEAISVEVAEALVKHPDIDFITLTANGEPTLYPKLYELVMLLNQVKNDKKILILSNGSTVMDEKVRKALKLFDVVKLSLDSARSESFKKIDRPIIVNPKELVEAMSIFRMEFNGVLVLETLFVKGVNDSREDVQALNEAYLKIRPDRIDLSTIDRPPAYAVEAITETELREIALCLDSSLRVSVATRRAEEKKTRPFSEQEIAYALKNRPFSIFDIEALFDDASKARFESMRQRGAIKEQEIAGTKFYWSF
jgi:wyosine [tRNA(Phe)-imidazoG37] synthetase (radical SAM superfamily)